MSLIPYVHLDRGVLRDAFEGEMRTLPEGARTHLERVLRLKSGADLVVADGEGREAAALLGVGNVVLDGPVVTSPANTTRLHLVQGLAKGRKTDDIVRSATELGVDSITVVESQRSVTKSAASKRDRLTQRWTDVARAAAEQSRRPALPQILGPRSLSETVATWPAQSAGVIGHPTGQLCLREALGKIALGDVSGEILVAIGPEGGWTDQEVAALEARGLQPVRFGSSILRTEHAGHALCAVVAFHLGRME